MRLAGRHLREHRLPDSAVDVIDEAGAALRLRRRRTPGHARASGSRRDRARDRAHGPHPREAGHALREGAARRASRSRSARVVFGQEDAVRTVVRAIKRSRAGLGHPDHPAGCFLFTGPTGVGKTELAKQLARQLGNEFHRYDMSEFMEKHAVARLIGAPPGYVGFEQGGLLVDAVRTTPTAWCCSTRSRRRTRTSSTSCCR